MTFSMMLINQKLLPETHKKEKKLTLKKTHHSQSFILFPTSYYITKPSNLKLFTHFYLTTHPRF